MGGRGSARFAHRRQPSFSRGERPGQPFKRGSRPAIWAWRRYLSLCARCEAAPLTWALAARWQEAQAALEKAGAQVSELERALGATPDPDTLRRAQGDLAYLNTLEANRRMAERESEQLRAGAEKALAAAEALADGQTATFLLTLAQMEDGDLLRGLVAQGHAIALLAQGTTADEVAWELEEGRALLWQAACAWLNLVWYEGAADIGGVLEEMGCGRVAADLDRRGSPLTSAGRASALLGVIGEYRRDLAVCLGDAGACLTGLSALGEGLEAAGYRVCSWRMGTA